MYRSELGVHFDDIVGVGGYSDAVAGDGSDMITCCLYLDEHATPGSSMWWKLLYSR